MGRGGGGAFLSNPRFACLSLARLSPHTHTHTHTHARTRTCRPSRTWSAASWACGGQRSGERGRERRQGGGGGGGACARSTTPPPSVTASSLSPSRSPFQSEAGLPTTPPAGDAIAAAVNIPPPVLPPTLAAAHARIATLEADLRDAHVRRAAAEVAADRAADQAMDLALQVRALKARAGGAE